MRSPGSVRAFVFAEGWEGGLEYARLIAGLFGFYLFENKKGCCCQKLFGLSNPNHSCYSSFYFIINSYIKTLSYF